MDPKPLRKLLNWIHQHITGQNTIMAGNRWGDKELCPWYNLFYFTLAISRWGSLFCSHVKDEKTRALVTQGMCVPQCSLGPGWGSRTHRFVSASHHSFAVTAWRWSGTRGELLQVLLRPEGVHGCMRGIAIYSSGTIWYRCKHHGLGGPWKS